MLIALSLFSLLSGGALTFLSVRYPEHSLALDRGAGGLMVFGLALLGALLPIVP